MASDMRQVAEFDRNLLNSSLVGFLEACRVLGEPMSTLGLKVNEAFQQTRNLIQYGLSNSEPTKDNPVLLQYFNAVRGVVDYAERTRDNKFINHLSTVKEAITALAWITVKPAPCQYIKDIKEAGDYFSIRVLTTNKGNEDHINWVNKWNQLMQDLLAYVKANFLTGMTWNAGKGKSVGGPPPPPPPPPPQFDMSSMGDALAAGDGARQALLAQLNQGSDITRGLKPVKRDGTQSREAVCSKSPASKTQAQQKAPARPPKFMLDGRKWVVDHQKSNYGMTINNDDMSQSLAMFGCEDSSLQVMNKINGVVIDNCKKSSIALKSVISGVELIRCSRLKIECADTVPLINMDNCDEIEIYLTPPARSVEIVSSKSTSCNVLLLEPSTGDYKELPLPEQIKTVLNGERLVSSVLDKN